MAPKKNTPSPSDPQPFGAGALDSSDGTSAADEQPRAQRKSRSSKASRSREGAAAKARESTDEAVPKRATRTRRKAPAAGPEAPSETETEAAPAAPSGRPAERAETPRSRAVRSSGVEGASPTDPDGGRDEEPDEDRGEHRTSEPSRSGSGSPVDPSAVPPRRSGRAERRRRWQERRRRRRLGLPLDDLAPGGAAARPQNHSGGAPAAGGPAASRRGPDARPRESREPREARDSRDSRGDSRESRQQPELKEVEGLLIVEKGNHAHLRLAENSFLPSKNDVHVAPWQVQKLALREGSIIRGRYRRGQGRSKWDLVEVLEVDGHDPRELRNTPVFKNLTTIDPDFHYALGDESGETSLKVVDLLAPIGRGQRGLIVASPRSGKTILLQQIAKAVEKIYPEVELMVLLVDERPEEATEWKRALGPGKVFVSTNDEPAKRHVELAEVVWRRARRLVELGKDVILLLDSITRLGRAANNVWGTSGKTMSGGIDSRALERPKQLFGSARNTEKAGSLTILATALVDTGSRMDQVIFEEFKGTGNMELVLSRKLADRRIFPAIDIEKTGTRKEEKLHSARRMTRVNTLRRVLMRMHWAEAMELLVTKLDDVEKIDDFLQRFEIDPDAGDEGKQAVSPVRMRW